MDSGLMNGEWDGMNINELNRFVAVCTRVASDGCFISFSNWKTAEEDMSWDEYQWAQQRFVVVCMVLAASSSGVLMLMLLARALRGRMNVIELDFSFGFWKEHVDYWWGFTFWTSVNNGCSWMNADYWHLGFVPVGWPGRSWQMRKSNREISM